jgi:hypothetical protein
MPNVKAWFNGSGFVQRRDRKVDGVRLMYYLHRERRSAVAAKAAHAKLRGMPNRELPARDLKV